VQPSKKERSYEKERRVRDKGIKKKKRKCYNYGKKGHFAADYYFKKNSTTTSKPKDEAKKPKPKNKGKEKSIINVTTRTQEWVNKKDPPRIRKGVKFLIINREDR
jgi:hypothetical protein